MSARWSRAVSVPQGPFLAVVAMKKLHQSPFATGFGSSMCLRLYHPKRKDLLQLSYSAFGVENFQFQASRSWMLNLR